MKRALIVSYDVPRPDRDCGSRRIHDLTLFLHESGWAVDYVSANGLGDLRHVRDLQRLGIAVHDDSPRPTSGGEFVPADVLARLVESVRHPLAILAFWPVAELYLPLIRRLSPTTRVVIDSIDLHYLRHARRMMSATADHPPLDAGFADQLIGELNTYHAGDAVMTVSDKEADILSDLSGGSLRCVSIAVCEDLPASPVPAEQRRGMLMLGSFQHPPNLDGLEYWCGEILPLVDPAVMEQHPLYVVGTGFQGPAAAVCEGVPHLHPVGWVPSVLPYFHRARVSIVPLRFGAGTKGKMVQALMTGTPTVASRVGAEGLNLIDGEHVLIADTAAEFAAALKRLLSDDVLWQRLAVQGRAHILATHARPVVREQFLAFLDGVLSRPAKPGRLPERDREHYYRRIGYRGEPQNVPTTKREVAYADLVRSMRALVISNVPAGSTIAVVNKGDDSLLQFGPSTGWHFPRAASGDYAGHYPADASAAVAHLEDLRQHGATHLLLPASAAWWLDHYAGFATHLGRHARRIAEEPDIGIVFALDAEPGANGKAHGSPGDAAVKLIAFYLPQFHPIPENDRWWGDGFTEWRNVSKAKPLFPGHHQPQLPADLGFYDLRLPETRAAQAGLARAHGIHGFCYYHYWFSGKRLLERPFQEVLASGQPDFPYCLCWANEPWSRRWDGSETDVLQAQSYSAEDDLAHIRHLLPALADPRAIRIDGKPVFLVYQAKQLPDPARTAEVWRREVDRAGLPGLYLLAVETGWDAGWDATRVGFDAKLLFQPQFSLLNAVPRYEVPSPRLKVFDYPQSWPVLAHPQAVSYRRYDCVFPSWDNTPRKGEEGWVVHNSTPAAYEEWLRLAVGRAMALPAGERVVFVNAWNEWAEGCHLEPDRDDGRAYLEATRRVMTSVQAPQLWSK